MDAITFDKETLPGRHVTRGSQRAPHRAFSYARRLACGQINQTCRLRTVQRIGALAVAASLVAAVPGTVRAEEGILGFGQSMFFSFREATKKLRPEFDIRIWASDLEKALRAYRRGQFGKALNLFKAAAEEGDVMAHWFLGRMFQLGQGTKANDALAFYHFRQAALAFNGREAPGPLMGAKLDSLVHVGRYYRRGIPEAKIKRQPRRAMRIFRTAAQYGHPGAQYGIGIMFYEGDSTEKRTRRGMRWLMLSAQKHYPLALAKLGEIYWKNGNDGPNAIRAIMWYTLAQNAARPEANPGIIDRYNEMAAAVAPETHERARQMALRWSQKFPPPPHRVLSQPVADSKSE